MYKAFLFLSLILLTSAGAASAAKWNHESELGLVLAAGNTVARTENGKHESKVNWNKNLVKAYGQYIHTLTEADGSEADIELWTLGTRYEREFSGISGFLGTEWDGNRDAGYRYRANFDIGGKHYFFKDKKKDKEKEKLHYLVSELGYRFQYEQKLDGSQPPLERSHFVRVFVEWGRDWNENTSTKFWIDVLPDISDSENIQINLEPSMSMVLTSLLSLKVAYLVKYDNVPAAAGLERVDSLYTTTLVAKY